MDVDGNICNVFVMKKKMKEKIKVWAVYILYTDMPLCDTKIDFGFCFHCGFLKRIATFVWVVSYVEPSCILCE